MFNICRFIALLCFGIAVISDPPSELIDVDPSVFFEDICDAPPDLEKENLVISISWYKEKSPDEHEFLVAHLKNGYFLIIDRCPRSTKDIPALSLSPSESSIPQVTARDILLVSNRPGRNDIIGYRNAKAIGTYKLRDCSILEFARLLDTIRRNCPDYTLDKRIGFWYTSTIVTICKSLFHGKGRMCSSHAGRCGGITMHTDDPREIDEITKKYLDARKADPDPLSPRMKWWKQFEELKELVKEQEQVEKTLTQLQGLEQIQASSQRQAQLQTQLAESLERAKRLLEQLTHDYKSVFRYAVKLLSNTIGLI